MTQHQGPPSPASRGDVNAPLPERRRPRILIVRRRYLGDTVLMQPFVRNLRAHAPSAWIAMVVDSPWVEALADVSELDQILELPVGGPGLGGHLRRWWRLLRSVAGRRWDVVIDFARNERAQLLVLMSRAPRRVALVPSGLSLRRARIYTDVVAVDPTDAATLHAVDLHNRVLQALGVPTPHRVPILPVPAEVRAVGRALLDGLRDHDSAPLVIVHPGSGAEARRWPPSDFARVADLAVRCHGARVAVLCGPGETGLAEGVVDAMSEAAVLLAAPRSVRALRGLLAEADLLLCNDSGPMHVAAAVGTPVCALFGSESVVTWAPVGDAGHRTFQAELPCGPSCVLAGRCVPGDPMKSYCIRRIPVEDVARAVCGQLEDAKLARGARAERARSPV